VLASYSSGVTGGTELKGGLIIAELELFSFLSRLTAASLKTEHVQRAVIAAGNRLFLRLNSASSPL